MEMLISLKLFVEIYLFWVVITSPELMVKSLCNCKTKQGCTNDNPCYNTDLRSQLDYALIIITPISAIVRYIIILCLISYICRNRFKCFRQLSISINPPQNDFEYVFDSKEKTISYKLIEFITKNKKVYVILEDNNQKDFILRKFIIDNDQFTSKVIESIQSMIKIELLLINNYRCNLIV
jgi:hypothetical protein